MSTFLSWKLLNITLIYNPQHNLNITSVYNPQHNLNIEPNYISSIYYPHYKPSILLKPKSVMEAKSSRWWMRKRRGQLFHSRHPDFSQQVWDMNPETFIHTSIC